MLKDITSKFYEEISGVKDLSKYIGENEGKFITISLAEYLDLLLVNQSMTKKELVRSTGIEKSYLYQIFNGRRTPSRDKLLRIAFALKLSLDNTQRLLLIAEKPILYPARKRDAAIMFCLIKGHSLDKTQIYLYDLNFEILE
ncbi:MAG TPA: helix-turn-helix transcriptional regulator [Clostridia bacterium]|nr:helix-turn-helix transcriptional regulator [Clostridia bacterium]